MSDHLTIYDKEFEIREYIHREYNEVLPDVAGHADVNVLWITMERISWFTEMRNAATNDKEFQLWDALREDFRMLFYGFMFALSQHSDEVARLRHQLAEKNARDNYKNVDSLAG